MVVEGGREGGGRRRKRVKHCIPTVIHPEGLGVLLI